MGQNQSEPIEYLNCVDWFPCRDADEKMIRKLRELAECDSEGDIQAKWKSSIEKRTKSLTERWQMFAQAIRILETWGKSRQMIILSAKQMELSYMISKNVSSVKGMTQLNAFVLVADSHLSLARAHLMTSQYNMAVDNAKKCLSYISKTRGGSDVAIRLSGHGYLCKGQAHLGLSNFKESLDDLETSLNLSHSHNDKVLECSVCCVMSKLYLDIKDYEKGIFFSLKASEIVQEHGKDWSSKYFCGTQLSLAEAYRKAGKLEEAMGVAEDSIKIAMETENRLIQAYCMLCFADTHRVRKDADRALPRYITARGIMSETGDRYGHVMIGIGMAKAWLKAGEISKALVEYEEALRIAESIHNKMACMRIYGEMTVLHERTSNHDLARRTTLCYHQMMKSMGLYCGVCDLPIGEKHEQLETLSCSHIFHLKCISEQNLLLLGALACPTCRKQIASSATTL